MSSIYIECPNRPPTSLYDATITAGMPSERWAPVDPGPNAHQRFRDQYRAKLREHEALVAKQKATLMDPTTAPVFICGDIEPEPFCLCGHTAELLCDYPMGRGKTCDINLCWCCGKHIGEEKDLCSIHFAEFVKKSGVSTLNPWPPKR